METHYIKTKDNYILKVYRIPHSKNYKNIKVKIKNGTNKNFNNTNNSTIPKPGILLFHGLIDSSDSWFANYESKVLPFILANNGYDVVNLSFF